MGPLVEFSRDDGGGRAVIALSPLDTVKWTADDRPYQRARADIEALVEPRIRSVGQRLYKEWKRRPSDPLCLFKAATVRRRAFANFGISMPPLGRAAYLKPKDPGCREYTRMRTLALMPLKEWPTEPGVREVFRSFDRLLSSDPLDREVLSKASNLNSMLKLGDRAKALTYARKFASLPKVDAFSTIAYHRLGFALYFSVPLNRRTVNDPVGAEASAAFARFLKVAPEWMDYERSVAKSLITSLQGRRASA